MSFESLKAFVLQGIAAAGLNRAVMRGLAADHGLQGAALLVVAIGGALSAVGHMNPMGVLYYPFVSLLLFLLNVAALHLMAGVFFKGKGTYNGLMIVLGAASVVNWVAVIPLLGSILGFAASLWFLVVGVAAVEELYRLDRMRAVLSVIVPIIAVSFLLVLFGLAGVPIWNGGRM